MTVPLHNAFFAELPAPRYFSIEPGRPFLADLARGLIAVFGDDLPRAEIYLPTRRAARALGDAILDARASAGVRASLLPRMRAIGDLDEEELAVFAGDAADELELAPPISATARSLALARLVAARDEAFAGHRNWPAAIAAARELGRLLDSLYTEEIDPARLDAIEVGDRAKHWDVSARFLKIVTTAWPAFLDAAGLSDPAWRRQRLIGLKAERLWAAPPAHPIVIAGTTASAPAVARLVKAIAAAPLGAAVLPGVDRVIDPKAFDAIGDAHPQAGLKALLGEIGCGPADIRPWPGSEQASPRAGLLRLALRPAEATDEWLGLIARATHSDPGLAAARAGLSLIEAESEDAEASIVAMLFRETLETDGATAMLVTPDRTLARRVALKMRRWDVTIDDSGGVPFANTPCGTFLRLVAGFLEDPGDPVAALALVRHPLARLALDEAVRRRGVDKLDRALRGPRRAGGLAELTRDNENGETPNAAMLAVIAALEGAIGEGGAPGDETVAKQMRAHLAAAERLAGGRALWAGDDGEAGAALLAGILADEDGLNAVSGARYPDLFDALVAGAVVRRRNDAHPRLSILGPLEARLMSADHVILGGLNEGVWPQGAPADPFLSRPMREEVGLPSPERRIGLAAHDFAQLAASPHVTLTRARRAGGAPSKPSRWLIRLRNILDGAGALAEVDKSDLWRARAEALDKPDAVTPAEPPRPRAGKGRRPAKLSVTQVETWIRDPYAVYARHLLDLKKLEEPGAPVSAREVGTILHRVFERAAKAPAPPPLVALRAILDEEASRAGLAGEERAFWSAALDEALDWFIEFDAGQRAKAAPFVEQKGEMTIAAADGPFTLTARADRIDVTPEGAAEIIDYKTGQPPSEKQDKYFSPQLALTGAMLEAGGFPETGAKRLAAYRYVKVTNRKENDTKNLFERTGDDARVASAEALARLEAWIAGFDGADAIYRSQPRPQLVRHEGDYDQLARRREWMASEDGEGDSE